MIRFFRTLRQRLLAENRLSKYLLYAVGEIVLVVIGILIALQFNNWNEHKRRTRELGVLFRNTDEFLAPLSYWGPQMFSKYAALDSLLTVMSEPHRPEFFREHPELLHVLLNDTLILPLKNYYWVSPGMKELIARKIDFPDSHQGLIYDLENWEVVNEDLENTNRKLTEALEQFQTELVERAPFLLDSLPDSKEKAILFVCQNEWFKFKVRSLARKSGDVLGTLDWNRVSLAELHGQLRLSEFGDGPEQIAPLFQRMGLAPAVPSEPPQPDMNPNLIKDAPVWKMILFNASGQEVNLELLAGENILRTRKLPANNLGQWGLNEGGIIRLKKAGQEARYYTSEKGRYLIIY